MKCMSNTLPLLRVYFVCTSQVCNHPELFERRDVRSPIHVAVPSFHLPKLIYREGAVNCTVCGKHKYCGLNRAGFHVQQIET